MIYVARDSRSIDLGLMDYNWP